MSEKPKRKWFQFHLLTLVLMVLLSGVLLRQHITPRPRPLPERKPESFTRYCEPSTADFKAEDLKADIGELRLRIYRPTLYGWPVDAYESLEKPRPLNEMDFTDDGHLSYNFVRASEWKCRGLALDALASLIILTSVAFGSEFLIRRREARKT